MNAIALESLPPEVAELIKIGEPIAIISDRKTIATLRPRGNRAPRSRTPSQRKISALEWLEKHAPMAPLALGAVDQFIAERRAE